MTHERWQAHSDVSFVWTNSEMSLGVMSSLVDAGYTSLRRFAAIADDRAGLRIALRDVFGLDPTSHECRRAQSHAGPFIGGPSLDQL